MYDLKLIPIQVNQGEQGSQRTGFRAVAPPRRAARSRSEDLLILSFTTQEKLDISQAVQQSWLDRLSHIFFQTGGSVTSALRALIETLNLTMMENNLKLAQEGHTATGAINLIAVHRRALFIAQSGLTHVFTLTHQGLRHFYDSSQSDRGLGLSRTPTIRYYQSELGSGGYLFMTDTPPKTYTEDLLFSGGLPKLDLLRRRLLNQAPTKFDLRLVQLVPGEGNIETPQATVHPEQPSEAASSTPIEPAATALPDPGEATGEDPADLGNTQEISREGTPESPPLESAPVSSETEAHLDHSPQGGAAKTESSAQTPNGDFSVAAEPPAPMLESGGDLPPHGNKETEDSRREKRTLQKTQIREESLKGLAAILDRWRTLQQTVKTFFQDLFARWTPVNTDGTPKFSQGTLLMIAVAVPLIVVAIAVGIYLSRGRTLRYETYFEQAQIASTNALSAAEPLQARENWSEALTFLDQAEAYKQSEEASELRKEAQAALDALDGAVRLAYQPAIVGSLAPEINITRIVSYGPDLYLFDSAGGRAIHATRSSQGYEIDPDFLCTAGNYSGGSLDSLVDIVSLPINNTFQAHILGIDAAGKAVYCAPGMEPMVQTLLAEGEGSGENARIVYAGNYLYILSPSAGKLRVYLPTNGLFLDPPRDYFEGVAGEEKPDLTEVVDLAVNGAELYLLQEDGAMINCVATGLPGNPVNCENPVEFIDGRPGLEEQRLLLPQSKFVSVLYTSPPDPAVSILDAKSGDIYRFSLRFRLHQRLRPAMGNYELDDPLATAFTIGIDRVAFIAFGHQVFYAYVD